MVFSKDISKAVETLYDERKNFIIIGLTGRTGAGCTTVASLLSKSFNEIGFPQPKVGYFGDNEDRKYSIVYNYSKENWEEFKIIQMRNIITSFILDYDFTEFYEYIKSTFNESLENLNNLLESFNDEFIITFNEMNKKRIKIKERIQKDNEALGHNDVFNFYFKELPSYTDFLKNVINKYDTNSYTEIYQDIANNIRSSGKPYDKGFNSHNIFMLSQRTNSLIKILRKRNLMEHRKVCVVIDAIRNPYEALFFKDRYSSFYLFSVNTEDDHRRNRLNLRLNLEQIDKLDLKEYPDKNSGTDIFAYQNIQKCIELSDVYLYNPNEEEDNKEKLKKQIVKYISLIMHPGLITPTHIERCMQIAYNAKLNSGCISRQVGALVTDDSFSIKSIGWNDVPHGHVPCNLRNLNNLFENQDKESFSQYELTNKKFNEHLEKIRIKEFKSKNKMKLLKGRQFSYCFKDIYNGLKEDRNQVHTRSLHAEENAFLQISKYGGTALKNGFLFTTASPCELCSKKAYQIGIKRIYYIDPYPGISEKHILNCGNQKPGLLLFYGAVGRAYTQFYTSIIPYKDELYMLLNFKFKK